MKKRKQIMAWLLAMALLITLMAVPAPVKAAGRTFFITKASATNAKRIHEALSSKTPLLLCVRGNKKTAKVLLRSVRRKVRDLNQQDVYFHFQSVRQKGKYFQFRVSKENAKVYYYSVKFCKKLFHNFKNGKCYGYIWSDGMGEKNGYTQYRYVYQGYRGYLKSGSDLSFEDYYANSQTEYDALLAEQNRLYSMYYEERPEDYEEQLQEIQDKINLLQETNFFLREGMIDWYGLEKSVAKTYGIAFKAKHFGELSDAMKVWVVAESGYFACEFDRKNPHGKFPKFCMIYSKKPKNVSFNSKGMCAMLNNKCQGVCANYAIMESLLWDQWGMINQTNSSWKINHAWSVVRATNSGKKALWIPFDYRIGPSGIYQASETEQFRLYLNGVKGAPKKKNYSQADFY